MALPIPYPLESTDGTPIPLDAQAAIWRLRQAAALAESYQSDFIVDILGSQIDKALVTLERQFRVKVGPATPTVAELMTGKSNVVTG